MKCGLPELNKDNVMYIMDTHVDALEIMRNTFEERLPDDVEESVNQIGQVMFALLCVKSIRADMRELQEDSMYSMNEIIELLDEVNNQYWSDFKLKTLNIITASTLGGFPVENVFNLDVCPLSFNYVFDVEDIMPILKKEVERK